MMNQYETPAFIAGKLPQIRKDLIPAGGHAVSIYQSMQVLADYTKRMALDHNLKMVENCMNLVERIYTKGNTAVKHAVENVFIFSFSSIMFCCNIVEWRMVQAFMPADLYSLYVQQVLKSK